jgi:hypothetical protein
MNRNFKQNSEFSLRNSHLHELNKGHEIYERRTISKEFDGLFFLFCILFVLLLLVLPSFVKYVNNGEFILLSSQSYSHLRLAEYIHENGQFPSYDWLSFAGVSFKFTTVFEFVLAEFSSTTGFPLFYIVLFLPVLFGLLSFILVYFLLIQLKLSIIFRRIFLLLLITSPLFLYLFSVSNYFYIPLFLILFSVVLFLSRSFFLRIVCYFLLLLLPFFGYIFPILAILILVLLYVKFKRKQLILLAVILFCSLSFFVKDIFGLVSVWNVSNFLKYSFLLTDFGYQCGFSLFSLMLSIIGVIFILKRNKGQNKPSYDIYFFIIFSISFCLFLFLNMEVLFFINFIVIFYAAHGFLYLVKFEYESSTIKYMTMIVLLSTAVFIPISYINHMHSFYPDREIVSAFSYLGTLSDYQYAVFSYEKHGTLINTIAKRPNIVDDYYFYLPKYLEMQKEINIIYYTRDILKVDTFFEKYNIRYVFIDSQMKKEIWIHDNQGLLFLLKNSDRFEKIYNTTNVVIYKYSYNKDATS